MIFRSFLAFELGMRFSMFKTCGASAVKTQKQQDGVVGKGRWRECNWRWEFNLLIGSTTKTEELEAKDNRKESATETPNEAEVPNWMITALPKNKGTHSILGYVKTTKFSLFFTFAAGGLESATNSMTQNASN